MRTLAAVILTTALSAPHVVAAQACVSPPHPLFEFQVEQPVAYVGDSTLTPRPAVQRFVHVPGNPSALVVQVVIDTLGQPEARSFHVLRTPSAAAADSVRAVLGRWRFTPARQGGCKVPQLLQTAVQH